MKTSVSPKKKKQYIRGEGFKNLYVIPYLRGRLVFAEIVARALEEDRFEQVIVDLPYFMNEGGLWEEAVKLFPHVSSLLFKKTDGTCVTFPFVPSDAACISLAMVQLLREWGRDVELACIDDSQVIHYPTESLAQPEIMVHDDYLVFTEGLLEYYRDAYGQLEEAWEGLSRDQQVFGEYRAGLVAERLRGKAGGGKKTLFVCEYRLWWLVQKILLSEHPERRGYFQNTWKDVEAALVIEEPLELWVSGAMDDMPAVVKLFYGKMQSNSLKSFDKLLEVARTVKGLFQPPSTRNYRCPSIRKILSFYQYVCSLLVSELRVTPLLASHLYEGALSCMGKKCARELAKRLLDYPYNHARKSAENYLVIKQDSITSGSSKFHIPHKTDRMFYSTGSERFHYDVFSDRQRRYGEAIVLLQKAFPDFTKEEKESLSGPRSFQWETYEDFRLYEIACGRVRDFFNRSNNQVRIQQSWGAVRDGIDWKATVASKAKGDDFVYIRTRKKWIRDGTERINEFTPIAYIFSDNFTNNRSNYVHDGNEEHENYVLGYSEKTATCDCVNTVFFTTCTIEETCYGHINKYRLSSVAFLYTRSDMGKKRYERIVKRPERFQCRTPPTIDPEITSFPLSERCIAWAVKYAENIVFVVAKEGVKFSEKLSDVARQRNVRIVPVPITRFHPDVIDRLRTLHMISNPLRRHPDCDTIVKRFID